MDPITTYWDGSKLREQLDKSTTSDAKDNATHYWAETHPNFEDSVEVLNSWVQPTADDGVLQMTVLARATGDSGITIHANDAVCQLRSAGPDEYDAIRGYRE